MADPTITVEVVLAWPERTLVRRLRLPVGSSVQDAVGAAALDEGPVDPAHVGIFGKRVDAAQALVDGDRVEIYRPLTIDPREARRRRAGG